MVPVEGSSPAEKQTVSHTAFARNHIGGNGDKVLPQHVCHFSFHSCPKFRSISIFSSDLSYFMRTWQEKNQCDQVYSGKLEIILRPIVRPIRNAWKFSKTSEMFCQDLGQLWASHKSYVLEARCQRENVKMETIAWSCIMGWQRNRADGMNGTDGRVGKVEWFLRAADLVCQLNQLNSCRIKRETTYIIDWWYQWHTRVNESVDDAPRTPTSNFEPHD